MRLRSKSLHTYLGICGGAYCMSLIDARTMPSGSSVHICTKTDVCLPRPAKILVWLCSNCVMSIIERIDDIIENNSLLKHKFYTMWSDGQLTIPMLSGYSKEYYQMVKAVPGLMERILPLGPHDDNLEQNMREEYDHIPLWREFAARLGVDAAELEEYEGLPKTQAAIDMMYGQTGSFHAGAAAMYALEKEIPRVSQTKLEGLQEFYGISDDIQYFAQHMEADIRHARDWSDILESADINDDVMIDAATKSVRAQNLLLDACCEKYCNNN